jgi:hypothetical protein
MTRISKTFGKPVIDRFVKRKKLKATAEEIEQFRSKSGDVTNESAQDLARYFIVNWKTERELQRTYGGRVIFQQFGPEALDARRRLFEEAEKAGDLRFDDPGVRHMFYYYWNMKHTVIGEKALEQPWFFGAPADIDEHASERLRVAEIPAKAAPGLAGKWRVFLPAGFEREITLTADEAGQYHLEPGHLNFSGLYEIQNDHLVSKDTKGSPAGQYGWKIHSPYLLTLTKQTAKVGSDYTGAVLFRSRNNVEREE